MTEVNHSLLKFKEAHQVLSISCLCGIFSFLSGITASQTFVFYLEPTSHLHLLECMLGESSVLIPLLVGSPGLCILQVSPYILGSLTSSTLSFHGSRRRVGMSGFQLPLNPIPPLTLESRSYTTCPQLTSLCQRFSTSVPQNI